MACPVTLFDTFVAASTYKATVGTFRELVHCLGLEPLSHASFYASLRAQLTYWRAQKLWTYLDKRAAQKEYKRQKVAANYKVLVIGAGPCGLRAAIECALLGAKVVVAEKREGFSRNNVLHIWPWVIADLKNLGAKLFYPKFCAGSIDHISIRHLQLVLLKVCLVLGVEVVEGVGFTNLVAPGPDPRTGELRGWRALFQPQFHYLEDYEFHALIGADGKRNTVPGFARRELRGKLAIGITANFKNRRSQAEEQVPEISGVAFIFNQQFFKDMRAETGIDLENIVYYKDETHYFVMCAKKASLLEKGVLRADLEDAASLLGPENVEREALLAYARQAADFATRRQLPALDFAVNGFGRPDVAMFDFTSLFSAENSCRILERGGHRLLLAIVGDSLHEPFWPTGSGCARGFLSVLDTAWLLRSMALGKTPLLEAVAEREYFYRRLAQTTPRNLYDSYDKYSIDPRSRYPVSGGDLVLPHQVLELLDTDDPEGLHDADALVPATASPARRRSGDNLLAPPPRDPYTRRLALIHFVQHLLGPYNLKVYNLDLAWADGVLLCALLHRFRPELVDLATVNVAPASANLRLGLGLLQTHFGQTVPESLVVALGLPPGTEVGPETRLPEEWDVDRDGMVDLLESLREYLRELVAERLRQMAAAGPLNGSPSQAAYHTGSAERKRKKRHQPSREKTLPSRALMESNRQMEEAKADGSPEPSAEELLADGRDLSEREAEEILREWEAEERLRTGAGGPAPSKALTEPRSRSSVSYLRDELFSTPKASLGHNLDPNSGRAGLVEKLNPDRIKVVEDMLLKDLPGKVRELEEKKRKTATVKARKLSSHELQDMERKLEETAMGSLLFNKDYQKPYTRQDELMIAAATADLKAKAENGFRDESRFANLDSQMRELDTKLRLPNKSGAFPVAVLKGTVERMTPASTPKASTESLASQPGPPVAQKKASLESLFGKKSPSTPVAAVKAMPRPATLPPLPASGRNACFVCEKEVYLTERLQVEKLSLHKACFRCAFCDTPLRLGGYGFERSGLYGQHFWCMNHLRLSEADKLAKLKRKGTARAAALGATPTTPGRILRGGVVTSPPAVAPKASPTSIAALPAMVGRKSAPNGSPITPSSPAKVVTPAEAFAPYTNSIFARLSRGDSTDSPGSSGSGPPAAQTPERAEFELGFAATSEAPLPSRGERALSTGELDEEEVQRRNHQPASIEQPDEEDPNEAERGPGQSSSGSSSPSASSSEPEEEDLHDWQRAELHSTLSRVGPTASLSYQDAAAIARSWRQRDDDTGEELDSSDSSHSEESPPPEPSSPPPKTEPLDPVAIRQAATAKLEAAKSEARERARLKSEQELLTPASRLSAPAVPSTPSLSPPDSDAEPRAASVADPSDLHDGFKTPLPKAKPSFLDRLTGSASGSPAEQSPPVPASAPSSESRKEAKVKAKMGRLSFMKRRRQNGNAAHLSVPQPQRQPPKACVDDELALTEEEDEAPPKPPRAAQSHAPPPTAPDEEVSEAEVRRVQRLAERLALEDERGRVYEAQELQRHLAELDVRQLEIRDAGRKAAQRLQDLLCASSPSEGRREACFSHWLVLAKEAARLAFREEDLGLKRRELELAEENVRLKAQLQGSFAVGGGSELEAEQSVLEALLGNVRERDGLNGRRNKARDAFEGRTEHLARLTLKDLRDPLPDYFPQPSPSPST